MSLHVCLGNAGIVLKKVLVSSKYLSLKKLTFVTFFTFSGDIEREHWSEIG